MTVPPDSTDLDFLSDVRLLARTSANLCVSFFVGVLLLLVLPAALVAPDGGAWLPVGTLMLGFLILLLFIFEASLSWEARRRVHWLLQVSLPDVPGVWLPERAPLSAYGHRALAQAALVPREWLIAHNGQHAYVFERHCGRWQRLARRSL